MNVTDLMSDIKIAWVTVMGTIGSGLGTVLEMIPNEIGKLATLVGIVLSSVLIYTHWRKGRIEYQKTQLEILILKEKEAERIDSAHRRKEEGLPARRCDDTNA
jgi:uncharacterized membrane protein YfcA